jgi:hypothetical protein
LKTISLSADDGNGFRPPCFAQLNKYKSSFLLRDGLPHPIAAFSHSWSDVISAFEECFRTLEALRNAAGPDSELIDEMRSALMAATRNLYYRATEFIENIDDSVSKGLSPDPKRLVKFSGANALRKRIALPCNKLKHNHNRIHYVQATALGLAVPGFSIYHVKDGALHPNPEVHKKRPAFSFNVELRRIFVTTYIYMSEVGENISRHCANDLEDTAMENTEPRTLAVIDRLLRLPAFGMPFETPQHMPSLEFDKNTFTMSDESGTILPAPIGCKMTATFTGDGFTTGFAPPGLRGAL